MKHYYEECMYNPDGVAPWSLKNVDCLRCLYREILWFEYRYRIYPKSAITGLSQDLA